MESSSEYSIEIKQNSTSFQCGLTKARMPANRSTVVPTGKQPFFDNALISINP